MVAITPKSRPGPEAVTWHGDNPDEIVDLVRRVAQIPHIWAPLVDDEGNPKHIDYYVNSEADTLHPGLQIYAGNELVLRLEDEHTLIFDPFATANGGTPAPLFAITPEHFEAFYNTGA